MTADEFLRHLEQAMPERSSLEAHGLDEDDIEAIQSTYVAPLRATTTASDVSEVERLVLDFDCSNVEVGLVRFNDRPMASPRGTCFAYCEADPLVVLRDERVALCDHASPQTIVLLCARDSSRFLDAMAAFVSLRRDKAAWKGRVEQAATRCAHSAGGPEYQAFYRSLVAFLENVRKLGADGST